MRRRRSFTRLFSMDRFLFRRVATHIPGWLHTLSWEPSEGTSDVHMVREPNRHR